MARIIALEAFLLICMVPVFYLVFVKLLHSPIFGRFIAQAKPGPETDTEIIDSYLDVERLAASQALTNERDAEKKLKSAARLRKLKEVK